MQGIDGAQMAEVISIESLHDALGNLYKEV